MTLTGARRANNRLREKATLLRLLIGYPVIDVRTASILIRKTFEATNVAIAKLVEHGILEEITGRSTNRLFGCYRAAALIRA